MSPSHPPTAFVSYSWDSDQHRDWVRELATRLRGDGIDVKLDQWNAVLGDNLPQFMETAVRENDYVLIVCTPRYKAKADKRTGGAGYEGDIITGEIYTTGNQRKFIPILREGEWTQAAPSWLLAKYFLDLRGEHYSEANYQQLVETLHHITPEPPPLGTPPVRKKQATGARPSTTGTSAGAGPIIQQAIGSNIAQAAGGGTAKVQVSDVLLQLARKPTADYRAKLRENLVDDFSDGDLHDLCFDMEIDYESLPGQGKSAKARELIAYCERRGRLPELVAKLYKLRPNVAWGVA
jgi:Effector-associated domain 7/TIR domain